MSNYSVKIGRESAYLPWPWVTFILLDGETMYDTCGMSFTRKGALRKARRQAKKLREVAQAKTEVIEL